MTGAPESGLAVLLRLDAAAAAALAPVSAGLPWPPHLTLAVLDSATPEAPLLEAVQALAARWAPLPMLLASLGRFPAGTCFLAPVPTAALLDRHAALLAALGGATPHPHHRAGAWVPHVTVAAEAALDLLPLPAMLDAMELVRFPPPVPVARHALGGTARTAFRPQESHAHADPRRHRPDRRAL